jgi:uncharacterized protein
MSVTFVLASFMMGVAGGPHCVVMCGGACAYLQQHQQRPLQYAGYHLGRLVGYSILGLVAAYSVKGLAWMSLQSVALQPVWTFFHVAIFVWGLILLIFADQPAWVNQLGGAVWSRLKPMIKLDGGYFYLGLLWALMPCGLLYSALIAASLQANPLLGAVNMAAFALGTNLSFVVLPKVWLRLKSGVPWFGDRVSMRLAGLFLSVVSAIAIWMDLVHKTKIWCVT